MGVIHPFAVEGHERIGDGTILASRDEHFLAAVGMQQHQIGAGIHQGGMRDLRPHGSDLVALSRSADIDNIVVVLDGLISREGRRIDVDRLKVEPLCWLGLLGQTQASRRDDRYGTYNQQHTKREEPYHRSLFYVKGEGRWGTPPSSSLPPWNR